MNNKVLISSDHHANWDALEKLFIEASKLEVPFIINGDIVGDYQFDGLRKIIGILYPQEILNYEMKKHLTNSQRYLNEEELNDLYNKLLEEKNEDILRHKTYLHNLFNLYIEETAKKLANLIDKYRVKTYFLLGNHEPIFFNDVVLKLLENKKLYIDLNKVSGVQDINGFRICCISNTTGAMPYLSEIFDEKNLFINFLHLQLNQRAVLSGD